MEIFIIIGLILLNGLLSMSEIALVSARKARLELEAKRGNKSAKTALKLANEPDRFLSTIQIGITLIGILTGLYSGEAFAYDLAEHVRRIPFLELTEEEWHRMMGINLDGVFYCCKAVLPHMVEKQSGTVINISSTASKTAHANASICYGASKAAVNSMTQKLAYEMGPYHIRVNGICPGPIETDMSLQWTEEYRRNVVKKIPLGVLGTTGNVADVAVFLASDMAGFINGETINVNGGSYMN